jgi:hypothetical protein
MLQSDAQVPRLWLIPANSEKNSEFRRLTVLCEICLENICEFRSLQGEFPAQQNRELIRDIRELNPPYQAGTGKIDALAAMGGTCQRQ